MLLYFLLEKKILVANFWALIRGKSTMWELCELMIKLFDGFSLLICDFYDPVEYGWFKFFDIFDVFFEDDGIEFSECSSE